MALLEKKVEVRVSLLPGAGKGLFSKEFIPKGTRIVEYRGKITTWREVDDNDGNNGYIYYVKRYHVIDASRRSTALARYLWCLPPFRHAGSLIVCAGAHSCLNQTPFALGRL